MDARPSLKTAPIQAGRGYVPAIDGLRAVAVISVVLFHLHKSFLPGGFVGVDIFFVISGFVVTHSFLHLNIIKLRVFLIYFYARRMIRIMPALISMLLIIEIFSDLFIPDAWLGKSSDAVFKSAFFGLSNIELILDYDVYFDPTTEYNTFVHTWSLGVEEQFYIIFPFLMFFYQKNKKVAYYQRMTFYFIILVSAISIFICAWLTYRYWRFSFYSIPARFWESGSGMILCLSIQSWTIWLIDASERTARKLMLISLGMTALALATPDSVFFPFPLALLPVVGTIGILALAYARPEGFIRATLSCPPVVLIGKMSYSIYLWHWPVFVLFRWTVGLSGIVPAATALISALGLGTISYAIVERPTRRSQTIARAPRGLVVAGASLGVGLAFAAGLAILNAKPSLSMSRTAQTDQWYADDRTSLPMPTACTVRKSTRPLSPGFSNTWEPEGCSKPQPTVQLLLVGDSHSLVYHQIFRRLAAEQGVKIRSYFRTGCSFLALDKAMADSPDCSRYDSNIIQQILATAHRGDVLFLPSLRLPRFADQWGGVQKETISASDRLKAIDEARGLVDLFETRGLFVVFEAPTPVFRSPAFRCSDWFNASNPVCSGGLTIDRDEFETLRAPVVKSMQKFVETTERTLIWDPAPLLCSDTICAAVTPQGPLFFDGDHLSGHGGDILYPSLSDLVSSIIQSLH